jgi:hypothetical protein
VLNLGLDRFVAEDNLQENKEFLVALDIVVVEVGY